MNGVFANEDPQPLNSPRKQRRGVSFVQIIIVWVALSILAVNIAILYVIHYADKPGTPKFTAVGSSDFMTLNGTELSDISEGTPVSVTDDGKITIGAGTSYYLNRHVFTDAKALYVQNNPLSNNTMLVSYFNGKQTLFNISTVSQYNPTAVSTSQVGSLPNPAKRVIPLSSSLVLIIANNVSSDFKNANNATNNLVVYPATIDGSSFTVLSDKGVVLNGGFGPSLSIGATKQSGSQLLVTIYGQDSKGVTNCYIAGVTVGEDKSLSVIKPTFFADDSNFTTTLTDPVALSGNDFFLPYYNDSGLCGIFATIENNNAFKLNTPGCLTSVKPQNFFSATPISDNRVAVAFSDSKQNNAIRVVDIAKYLTGIPTFGSIYTLDTGDAFLNVDGAGQLFYQLNIGNIGEGRVLVTFSDMANQGIITGQVLTITSISGFLPITPPMPMSVPVSETGTYVFNEIAYLGNNRFSLVYSYWLGKNTFSFGGYDIGEILPTPLGIVGDSSNVLVSGSAYIPDSSLKLGVSYYSTTQGKLVAGLRHGSTYPYITTDNGTTVVSLDSYIGVAADSSTLVLNR